MKLFFSSISKGTSARLIRNYLSTVDKLSQLAFTAHSTERLLESSIDLIRNMLQVEQASVLLLDPVTEDLSVKVFRGLTLTEAQKYRLKPGEGIAGKVILGREPHLMTSQHRSSPYYSHSPNEPVAALYVPLVVGHEARGVIALGSAGQQRLFTSGEVKAASTLAGYISLAMENTRLNSEISGLSLNLLKSLAMAIDARDNYTRMHSMRVTRYAVIIGVHMGLSQDDIEILRRGSLLHDIGKIGIRDDILLKPGGLTEKEFEIFREHPGIGARILGPEGPLRLIVPLVLYNHERYDGNGYPHGLKGEDIPVGARIIAVADAFEAMTADRPYRRALSVEKAVLEIHQNTGSQFAPDIVRAFMEVLKEDMSDIASGEADREPGTSGLY